MQYKAVRAEERYSESIAKLDSLTISYTLTIEYQSLGLRQTPLSILECSHIDRLGRAIRVESKPLYLLRHARYGLHPSALDFWSSFLLSTRRDRESSKHDKSCNPDVVFL